MSTVTNFTEFYQKAYGQFSQEHRVAGSLTLSMLMAHQNSHETLDKGMDCISIGTLLTKNISHAWLDAGYGKQFVKGRYGASIIHAPNTDALFHTKGKHSILILAADRSDVEKILLSAGIDNINALDSIFFKEMNDPIISRSVQEIWKQSILNCASGSLLVDAHFNMFLSRLVSLADQKLKISKTQLSQKEVANAIDIMDAQMGNAINVSQVCTELDMSSYHFSRAFKKATGELPHTFMTERRIERAKDLLANSNKSIAEIAYACGYSSQSHLTTAFRKVTGDTPGRYRKAKI